MVVLFAVQARFDALRPGTEQHQRMRAPRLTEQQVQEHGSGGNHQQHGVQPCAMAVNMPSTATRGTRSATATARCQAAP
ncbi:hypothetical protein KWM_0110165 [Xanthomonas vasicola pv. musacearum NCPPB 2005]|nr:hypothetical protein KWQ_0118890 [Xanthomonas vasicola pv. musacearum NCPPB 4380]KFA09788.1 hypothetical protein KWM_0110165 [Xanthomonas vasicola pv. musacearum NCPPB 2005]KFA17218.1 hypothetical protein KWU_0121735 [Xanthomonas vasicola pv. musacearum NCPPB 4394]KFA21874.1 hypothetical protein A11G_0100570 [Xanthomonas vasicola pv. musacearum NCPPB 4392]KFA39644.1 hypothetical protein KWS_0102020 [Xanthomonas vasicola pv. musacearum NCPPB 4384]